MKIIIAFLLISTVSFSQNHKPIQIRKVKFEYKIKDVVAIVSVIPQITISNKLVQNKINASIKKSFNATSQPDKATYIKNVLKDYDVKTVEEYKKHMDDEKASDPDFREDIEDESYSIEFLSKSILSISIIKSVCPYHGTHCMASFESICYDLKTGKKLEFKDFFSIDTNKLIEVLVSKGYDWEPTDVGEPEKYLKIDPDDEYLELNIKDLFTVGKENNGCTNFYFHKVDKKIHVIFNLQCAGPQYVEYGISLEYLKPYLVKYFK